MGNFKIIFGSSPVSFADSVFISIISMSVVFSILILLTFILYTFRYIPQEKKLATTGTKNLLNNSKNNVHAGNDSIKFNENDIEDDYMRVAIMVASIEARNDCKNGNIKVKAVRRIK